MSARRKGKHSPGKSSYSSYSRYGGAYGQDPASESREARGAYGAGNAYDQPGAYGAGNASAAAGPARGTYVPGSSAPQDAYSAPAQGAYAAPAQGAYAAPAQHMGGPTAAQDPYDDFLRSSSVYAEIARTRKRKRRMRRVLTAILAVVVLMAGAGGAYAYWFTGQLDRALAPDAETLDKLSGVLVPSLSGEPFYMLVVGSDSREGNPRLNATDDNGERSDVMILTRVDPAADRITMLSIPRDTPYQLEDGTYVKINEMLNLEGVSGTVRAVSDLTGVSISHYAEVHISGLEAIVDLLGGITVDVPVKMSHWTTDWEKITLEPGVQTLDGAEAQIFARARHQYEGNQEANRQSNVRILLEAIIKATLNRPISQIPDIVLKEAQYVDTDLTSGEVIALATGFSSASIDMSMGTGPTEGAEDPYLDGIWYCYEDPDGWQRVIAEIEAGGDPDDVSYVGDWVTYPGSVEGFVLE